MTSPESSAAAASRAFPELPRRWVFRASGAPVALLTPGTFDALTEELAGGADSDQLASALKLPRSLCRLLVLRGHGDETAAKRFLKPQLTDLHDPFALADMQVAVQRLVHAIRTGERILVHGDYDVDGICAAVLLARVLRRFHAVVEPFVPHRMTDGYDLGYAGVRRAIEVGAGLIVTGDCGVVAHDAIAEATAAGIDVIVTDHHTPGATLPPALAVLNPNRADCVYPDKGLCGAGVAFKLCEALVSTLGGDRDALLWDLDLVALATIADLAPLRGENRILTYYGLRVLRQTRNPGLRALLRVANVNVEHPIVSMQVSHLLAPRINAVGRMGAASRGVRLLLCDDDALAESLATEMDAENRTRQEVDRRILTEALGMLEAEFDPAQHYAIVLSSPDWHPGVIGIVAARVVERVHRPVVLIAEDPERGRGRGSARSIPPFHLYDGVQACSSLLDRYGGHRQAAGLELRLERLGEFRRALNDHARTVLTPDDLVPELRIDLEIRLAEADVALHRLLRHLGPFGIGHPQPVFVARNIGIAGYPREAGNGQHLKLMLADGGTKLPAIGFRMAERARSIDFTRTRIDVAFHLHEDRWNGRSQLQARLVDVRPAT